MWLTDMGKGEYIIYLYDRSIVFVVVWFAMYPLFNLRPSIHRPKMNINQPCKIEIAESIGCFVLNQALNPDYFLGYLGKSPNAFCDPPHFFGPG